MIKEKILRTEEEIKRAYNKMDPHRALVLTNGCFDLFHAGHANLLEKISLMELPAELWVGINSDRTVKELKGPHKPYINQEDRAFIVASHQSVDRVFIFDEKRLTKWINILRPEAYYKGRDYNINTIDKEEREALVNCYCDIRFIELEKKISSSIITKKIISLYNFYKADGLI